MAANQERPRGGSSPRPPIGTPFNPNREICHFYAPDIVARQTDLTDGQKRLYERAVRWSGKNGVFWYSFDAMAKELGKSARQLKRDMAKLEKRGLILHERRGKQQSNLYTFLYHGMFQSDGTSTSHHSAESEVTYSSSDVTSTSRSDVTPASHELCKEKYIKESSSSANSSESKKPDASANDDDLISSQRNNNNTAEWPSSSEPATPIEEKLKGPDAADASVLVGNHAGLEGDLVKIAQEKLYTARAASLDIFRTITPEGLAATTPPDRELTLQILRLFAGGDDGGADFEEWLKSTVDRQLGRKAKGPRWGLYLADARTEAEALRAKREAAPKLQAAMDASRAREEAEQAEQERAAAAELDQPMPALEAYERIRPGIGGRGLPRPLKWRLERTGELISPNALEASMRGWKRCPTCQDSGTVGTAIDRTLAFCPCEAGIETQHPPVDRELGKPEAERFHRGADYCRRTIERVHESAKSLLVAAHFDVGQPHAADAIAESDVSDDGDVLEIRIPDTHFAMKEDDVDKALGRLKWKRRIVITGGRQLKRPQTGPMARPGSAAPSRPPITQADIDAELAKSRQKIPPQMETGCDITIGTSAGGIR